MLVVSTGSVEANQTLGLHSPILLDSGAMGVGSSFGANGTPMAVLIDAEGRSASRSGSGWLHAGYRSTYLVKPLVPFSRASQTVGSI